MSLKRTCFIAFTMAPWSLWLKSRLREQTEPFLTALRIKSPDTTLISAWLYWVLDGELNEDCSFTGSNGIEVTVFKHNPSTSVENTVLLYSGDTKLFAVDLTGGNLCTVTDFTSGEAVPLIFPEGDGLYYRDLEIREQGISRILPDQVIDEALDFSDSVKEPRD